MRVTRVGGAVLVLGGLVTACGTQPGPSARSAKHVDHTVLVNRATGDRFTPADAAQLGSVLTSSQALAAFKAKDPEFRPQKPVANTLGKLTQGSGDENPVPPGTTVWALTWHDCPQPHGIATSIPNSPCVHWLFLNAHNGHMIVAEFQDSARS